VVEEEVRRVEVQGNVVHRGRGRRRGQSKSPQRFKTSDKERIEELWKKRKEEMKV